MDYFISDLHLFHANSLKFDNRPFNTVEEMHEVIINNWNSKVTNGDTVYILGDISMKGTNEEVIKLISILKGHKVLIKGNHDRVNDHRYQQLFQEIIDYKEIQVSIPNENDKNGSKVNTHVVLSHYPILFWNRQHRGSIHLYGHVHCSIEEILFQETLDRINASFKEGHGHSGHTEAKAYNVGCMMPWMNYTPRTLEEIIKGFNLSKSIDYRGELNGR